MPSSEPPKIPSEIFREFETFGDQNLMSALEQAKDFANASKPRWLSFVGKSGTGKTFLAKLVYEAMFELRPNLRSHKTLISGCQWAFWPNICNKLRNREWWLLDTLSDANLCFIDEVCCEYDPSGMLREKLCEILSRRVGKWTLLTSNLTLAKLGEIDLRIPSRMIRGNSVVVEMDCQDYWLRTKE